MKFELLFLGKTKDNYLSQGISEYTSRLQHYTSVSVHVLKCKKKAKAKKTLLQEQEGRLLLDNVPKGAFKVALDSGGKQCSSEELALLIGRWQQRGIKQVDFLIGGPLGLSSQVLGDADEILSLSKMTFTHDMVRLFLLEQLYRAFTILAGEKYHK